MTASTPHATRPTLPLRAGTRGSPLALVQTRGFLARLSTFCPVLAAPPDGATPVFAEHVIRTTGDAVRDRPLAELGGKGLFAKEIHEAMAAGTIDIAVHSLKDLETELPEGIALACVLPREDPRDALILAPGCATPDPADPLAAIPRGGVVGTCSPRRAAQILAARPDLRIAPLRGNVETRLSRIRRGDFAATLLALAGLRRLGLADAASVILEPGLMLPAVGQGIVGVTMRTADLGLARLLAAIEDPHVRAVATAERAMLAGLGGSCRTPIGGHATIAGGMLTLDGMVASEDGTVLVRRQACGRAGDAAAIGAAVAAALLADAPGLLVPAPG
ncbi:MAG: hydroxymethylbilane synthase [Rhodospirillales bacterium]|nr:hydroxymethylbilane synthase [Rhodospirillales bacterium]